MTQKTTGRPTLYDCRMSPYTVSLAPQQIKTAIKLGNGNISAGIRRALDEAAQLHDT